ncbi:IS3 family transposase [Pseudonocardia sp. N23]|uniref:IS3 family transposase n=1 Tax=Pseudonocardia sp. N23 TaxID=1987376 RepID=UPI000BFE7D19
MGAADASSAPRRWRRDGPFPSPRVRESELLVTHIERIHTDSRGTCGWRRPHAEPAIGPGIAANHKRVARLMHEAGIHGLHRRRRPGCTVCDLHADPCADLAEPARTRDGGVLLHRGLLQPLRRHSRLDNPSPAACGQQLTTQIEVSG